MARAIGTTRRASVVLMLAVLGGCSTGAPVPTASTGGVETPDATALAATASAPGPTPGNISGLYSVGDHKLFIECIGAGQPTVVYVAGLGGTRQNAGTIPGLLAGGVRVCTYDRANVGASDHVAGTHTAVASADELHALLDAAGIQRPIVLLGASFGGLISIDYAGKYPSDVAGLVLLDAILPTDASTDHFVVDPSQRAETTYGDDVNPEGVIASASLAEAAPFVDKIANIPVTYLEAKQLDLPSSAPAAQYSAAIFAVRDAFIARFAQGRLVKVDSVHFMEPVIPEQISQEVHRVLDNIRGVNPSAGAS